MTTDNQHRPWADLATLRAGYRECARLTRRYGTTYFWGALLLPRRQRRHVYAVYALCRLADDIVDDQDRIRVEGPDGTAAALAEFADSFRAALADPDRWFAEHTDAVLAAVVTTVRERGIDAECFDRFFGAMALDLTTTTYQTWEDLCTYMEGSAAVIGEMMLPLLEPTSAAAREPARTLGLAFQLTNFLRDVDEDLDRGRIYLPQAELRAFGVDLSRREATPQWRAFLAFQIERTRDLYRRADAGIAHLPPHSARCVGAARVLYSRILDRIEAQDHDVFAGRARVPTWSKALTAARILLTGPPRSPRPGGVSIDVVPDVP